MTNEARTAVGIPVLLERTENGILAFVGQQRGNLDKTLELRTALSDSKKQQQPVFSTHLASSFVLLFSKN